MAKKTRTELSTLAINTNLPDNTTELITPTTERAQLTDERESVVNYKDDLGGVPNAGKFLTVAVDGESLTMVDEPQGDIQGSGVDGQITYWDGTKTVTSDAMLLIDTTNKRLKIVIPAANTGGGISLNAVSASASSSLTFLNNGVTYAQLYYDNSTGNLRLASDGDVEINPSGTLSVDSGATFSGIVSINGQGFFRGDSSGNLRIQGGTTATEIRNNANNSSLLTILNGGDVGIGRTPSEKLHVQGNTRLQKTGVSGSVDLQFYQGNNASINNSVNYANIQSNVTSGNTGFESGKLVFQTRNSGTTATRLTISSGGNVLIGNPTSDTGLKLQVHGADGTSYLKLTSTVATTGGRIGYNGSVLRIDQQENNDITFRTNGSEKMRISSGGDVEISNSVVPTLRLNNTDTSLGSPQTLGSIEYYQNDASDQGVGTVSRINCVNESSFAGLGALTFETGTSTSITERLRISSVGNVLIAQTTANSNGNGFGAYPAGSSGGFLLNCYNGSGGAALRIGKTSTGIVQLFVRDTTDVGSISLNTSSTSFNTTSDYRLKENVTPITDALSRLNQLKPSRFNFIADADKIVDGFIAHEVEDIVPEAICGEKDAMKDEEYEVTPRVDEVTDEEGNVITEAVEAVMETRSVPDYQGIDQSKIVPLLTAAIQEQQTIIEDLKARIEKLEL